MLLLLAVVVAADPVWRAVRDYLPVQFGMPPPAPPGLAGMAVAVDGDSLLLNGERIRLDGVDAPEAHQLCERGRTSWACGAQATGALRSFLHGKNVRCVATGRDRYQRAVGTCWADGQDVGGWLVRQGLAVAYTRFSARYVEEEEAARRERLGLWAGNFETPEDWRRHHPR
jgi:endonuclease YncB( thermonuclease family)